MRDIVPREGRERRKGEVDKIVLGEGKVGARAEREEEGQRGTRREAERRRVWEHFSFISDS